ncbi:gliding motility-associated C-terminal domain-containing protein [Bacteroidota bacterium]
MQLRILNYTILLILIFVINPSAFSQLTFSGANYEYALTYSPDTIVDPVYVFHSPDETGQEVTSISGTFSANHSSNDTSTFTWMKFNINTLDFDIIKVDSNVSASDTNIYDLGCYRVEITDTSDSVEIYTAWIHIDHVAFTIRPTNKTCRWIDFKADYSFPNFYFYHVYDTLDPRLDSIINETNVSKNVEGETPDVVPLAEDLDIRTFKEDKSVDFVCTDSFQNTISDYYYYESYLPDVTDKMEAEHSGLPDEEADTYFATDEVTFYPNGENYDSIMWLFGDTITPYIDDSTFTDLFENTYKYIKPGKYMAKIIAKNNDYGCKDRDSIEFTIVESQIEIPGNTITPVVDYGDVRDISNGQNDYFIVKGKSIRNFKIRIFDRWGRIVFKEELIDFQPINDETVNPEDKGVLIKWDGTNRVAIPDRKCPTGVYFYIIEAEGWDGRKFGGKKNKEEQELEETDPATSNPNNDSSSNKNKKYPQSGTIYLFR